MPETQLTGLLAEAFGALEALPRECRVRLAIEDALDNFAAVIQSVTEAGQRQSLIQRLRAVHPAGRAHQREDDEQIDDVFTEAKAFAWTREVAGLGSPQFVLVEGCPDLRVRSETWIEAKRLRNSDVENAEVLDLEPRLRRDGFVVRSARTLGPLPREVIKKLDEKLDDSIRKWERQDRSGQLVTFFSVNIDFGVSFRDAPARLRAWGQRSALQTGSRVVICYMSNDWLDPFFDSDPVIPK